MLVVDDEDDVRGLVRELLERAGYEVAEATSERAGLRALHAAPPDLVVLDVTMPELDGFGTLERIRDLSDVPVLMLTARGQELEKVRGLQGAPTASIVPPPRGSRLRTSASTPPAKSRYADMKRPSADENEVGGAPVRRMLSCQGTHPASHSAWLTVKSTQDKRGARPLRRPRTRAATAAKLSRMTMPVSMEAASDTAYAIVASASAARNAEVAERFIPLSSAAGASP